MVPKTFVGQGWMRSSIRKPAGWSRLASASSRSPKIRNARDYAIRSRVSSLCAAGKPRGKALVENGGGGKTVQCSICHGEGQKGLGNVPRIAGVHPIHLARQLYLFKEAIATVRTHR